MRLRSNVCLETSLAEAIVLSAIAAALAAPARADARKLFWGEAVSGASDIRRCEIGGGSVQNLVTNLQWTDGLSIDATAGKLYWTDASTGSVWRSNLDLSGVQTVSTSTVFTLTGLALDVERGHVYWSTSSDIVRANFDGSNRFTFLADARARSLAYDAANDDLYWTTNFTSNALILRSSVITPALETVLSGLPTLGGIAVDAAHDGGTVFFSEIAGTFRIRKVRFNGTALATVTNTTAACYEIELYTPGSTLAFHDDRLKSVRYDGTLLQTLGPTYSAGHAPRGLAYYPGVRLYVKPTGNDGNDGLTWATALREVQTAINKIPGAPVAIWVQAGTYKPTGGTDRTVSFALRNDVELYGGFAGTETSLAQRNVAANPTILSGDLSSNDGTACTFSNQSDNSYHVVTSASTVNASAILDGFVIRGGHANGTGGLSNGGGAYLQGSPTIRTCTIECNSAVSHGGGVYISGSPALSDCLTQSNDASGLSTYGDGIYSTGGSPRFLRCRLYDRGNSGILAMSGGSPQLIGSEVAWSYCGPGVRVRGGAVFTAVNCTIRSNDACQQPSPQAAGIRADSAAETVILTNCVLAYNGQPELGFSEAAQLNAPTRTITNCFIQGWTGGGTSTLGYGYAPYFVDNDGADNQIMNLDDNLQLTAGSPLVNAGLNSAVPSDYTLDLNGQMRIRNGTVDIGAYEFQGTPVPYVPPPPMLVADSNPTLTVSNNLNTVTLQRTHLDSTSVQWNLDPALAGGPVQITFPLSQYNIPNNPPAIQCDDLYNYTVFQVPEDPFVNGGEVEITYELEGSVTGMLTGQRLIFGWDLGDDDQPSLLGGPYDDAQGATAMIDFAITGTGSVYHEGCPGIWNPILHECEYGTFDGAADGDGDPSSGELEYEQGFEFGSAFALYGITYGWFIAVVDFVPGATNTVTVNLDVMRVTFSVANAILGDLNNDGVVNITDLLALLAEWGPCPPPGSGGCPADLNADGTVNVSDLLLLLANWG